MLLHKFGWMYISYKISSKLLSVLVGLASISKVLVHICGMQYVNVTTIGKACQHTAMFPYVRMPMRLPMWQVDQSKYQSVLMQMLMRMQMQCECECECECECHRVDKELWRFFTNLEQERLTTLALAYCLPHTANCIPQSPSYVTLNSRHYGLISLILSHQAIIAFTHAKALNQLCVERQSWSQKLTITTTINFSSGNILDKMWIG